MKVESVNLSDGIFLSSDRKIANMLYTKLRLLINQLHSPSEKFVELFEQLKFLSPINKTTQDQVLLEPGGVVGDRHFLADSIEKLNGVNHIRSRHKQVLIINKERYEGLNKFYNKNLQPGQLGENILVSQLGPVEAFKQGTILQFGETACVELLHLRTFCYKFSVALFPTADEFFAWHKNAAGAIIRDIGVTGRVVCPGVVRPGDQIKVIQELTGPMLKYFDPDTDGMARYLPI